MTGNREGHWHWLLGREWAVVTPPIRVTQKSIIVNQPRTQFLSLTVWETRDTQAEPASYYWQA